MDLDLLIKNENLIENQLSFFDAFLDKLKKITNNYKKILVKRISISEIYEINSYF